MKHLFSYHVVIYFTLTSLVMSQNPKVNTKFGIIVGNEITVSLELPNAKVHQYLGIPFAKPPVGNLRFRKPEPVTSLPSPFYAQNFSAICPQRPVFEDSYSQQNVSQSEDCLYLNLYVPGRPAETKDGHAVMVWIYGGGFQEGAGSHYDFSTLSVAGNIIVVTFNYRLGVFGFLNSISEDVSGNYGLWDQHMVFQWVHDNIRNFGGNNERVTIAGESAGAMSVIQHALFPANRGLFQRIIAQSGSMSIPAMDLGRDRNKDVHILAESVGCTSDFLFDILECLRAKSVDELLAPSLMFNPTLDGELIKINTRDIAKIAETRSLDEVEFFRSLDILSGFNTHEGIGVLSTVMHFLPKEMQSSQLENLTFNKYFWRNHYIPAVMNFTFQKQFPDEIIKLVEAQYTPWSKPDDHQLLRLQFEKLVGDLNFAVPAIQMARLHAMSPSANNFMYHFAPKPSIRALPIPSWIPGAGHADEIRFVMGTFGGLGVGEENAWENDLIRKMMTYWTNFVKSG